MAPPPRNHTNGASRRSTLGPNSLDAQLVELEVAPSVRLKKIGLYLRSDQMKLLKAICLDLKLDDYDYSQAEMIRTAIADFLELSFVEQIERLENNRRREAEVGVGIASVRPGG